MLTRCPECATHFRVTPEQLKQRAGRVRCGECQHVFNALDTLIEEAQVVVVPAPAVQSAAEQIEEAAAEVSPPSADVAPPEVVAAPESPPAPNESESAPAAETSGLDMVSLDAANPPPPAEHPSVEPEASPETVPPPPSETPSDEEPWDDTWQEPPPPRRWPWVLGSLIALLAIALQATYAYRVEIAVLWPEMRPALVAACQTLGCEVGMPAKIGLVGIEASDLHPEAAQKGRLALTATLKSRAPFAQRYPHLELTLTDTADKAIVRKVLAPAAYLPPGLPATAGMAPGAEISVSVNLDAGEIPASGYRLYIFYP